MTTIIAFDNTNPPPPPYHHHHNQDAFIGFGGNQIRERVKKGAKWFVSSFYDLIEELEQGDDDDDDDDELEQN